MQSPIVPAKRRLPAILLSVALHGGALAVVALLGNAARTRLIEPSPLHAMALVEVAGGSHHLKIPLPPLPEAAHTRDPDPQASVTRKTILPMDQPQPKASGGGAPPAPHHGNGSGQAMRGNGSDNEDGNPAYPVFAPNPPVRDRSLLPRVEQKIVVDVSLDVAGGVVSETLVKGMGNSLDQIVLDIVKTWRFQPATVNGKPIPSEAELIFPFNQSYPIADS
jgi:TonB family protein